jgi:hypothetical protein
VYPEVVRMFSANLLRSLPPPLCRPVWSLILRRTSLPSPPGKRGEMHAFLCFSYLLQMCVLQNAYELFLKFLEMCEFDVPTAKTCLDSKFENVCHGLHVYLACTHSLVYLISADAQAV